MRRYVALLALWSLGALPGCVVVAPPQANTPWRWSRPATSYDEFLRTRYYCLGWRGYYDGWVSSGAFFACMSARAFQIDPYGPFVAPTGEPL